MRISIVDNREVIEFERDVNSALEHIEDSNCRILDIKYKFTEIPESEYHYYFSKYRAMIMYEPLKTRVEPYTTQYSVPNLKDNSPAGKILAE